MVYIASDQPIPRLNDPYLSVSDVPARRSSVMAQFTLPHVCNVGSHSGCGCGFQVFHPDEAEESEHVRQSLSSRLALCNLLCEHLAKGRSLEMFACWDGDEGKPPRRAREICPADLLTKATTFEELEWFRVVLSPQAPGAA